MPSHVTTLIPNHSSLSEYLFVCLLAEALVSMKMDIKEALIDVEGFLMAGFFHIETFLQCKWGPPITAEGGQSPILGLHKTLNGPFTI